MLGVPIAMGGPKEGVQKQIQQDWANREYIEVITGSIKKITDFLNSFGKQQVPGCDLIHVFILVIKPLKLTDFY